MGAGSRSGNCCAVFAGACPLETVGGGVLTRFTEGWAGLPGAMADSWDGGSWTGTNLQACWKNEVGPKLPRLPSYFGSSGNPEEVDDRILAEWSANRKSQCEVTFGSWAVANCQCPVAAPLPHEERCKEKNHAVIPIG